MPIHNKLVRDRIPEVIEATGKAFSTRILDEEEYKVELKKKMQEELTEYLAATSDEEAVEELADLLELIHAAATIHGASVEELEEVRKVKAEKRGGFAERIYLIEVKDD
ncbi:nucleoside triphosphate pyrophosphohydrolase [Planomicrobium sp. YIM 101495]|uniref:nucleoside triphosphate pyrophosphohydrolase n=1 Tax=Planomicrobium sp. YIM 101495 TaxID=2665160 RepID=UPI0012B8E9EF|nr:nucleoside triphosphate pyrophosphohydrolase [Planomicrobium sp. YIM 101495]MTD32018.1 phosphoribosyl-ATP pyrophosphohydrolase [Planomicrobium sp. YIM 101495]